ncbi:acyclic terpene utilization AtuA family protein [Anderseniella sp. Alg231-50]|uniref:acyclic terpene utilization AtuA family protein n=1 Tax=Anderseniella sp. Alg231-50 TaxID=1922226 RepID=UPI000D559B31
MGDVHIAAGAGFSNDRRELGEIAAQSLTLFEGHRYLIFECLAERTLALAQSDDGQRRQIERAIGYLEACINTCILNNIKIISNFGGSAPKQVAEAIAGFLKQHNLRRQVGYVLGDELPVSDTEHDGRAISRNAYIGANGIVEALDAGADIVVTGRVADPSLVVGAVAFEHELKWIDWNRLAQATLAGHLIECGTQVCGGYFADTGAKQVPGLTRLGAPVASVARGHDRLTISKPLGGGLLTTATVTEQMLYEIHDPARYLTPDVVMDISGVAMQLTGNNEVTLTGCVGHARPDWLKTLTCVDEGWIGEGEISYMGDTCLDRAQMARTILTQRLETIAPSAAPHFDIIGAMYDEAKNNAGRPRDVRLRMAVASHDRAQVRALLDEVEALYLNGPAGGGGIRLNISARTATVAGAVRQNEAVSRGYLLEDTP